MLKENLNREVKLYDIWQFEDGYYVVVKITSEGKPYVLNLKDLEMFTSSILDLTSNRSCYVASWHLNHRD